MAVRSAARLCVTKASARTTEPARGTAARTPVAVSARIRDTYVCPAAPRQAAHTGRGIALTTFRELGILPETAEALEAVGIINAFPIQEMTLPVAMGGHDVIGQAKTGTGKTLGFGLPIIDRVKVAADVDAGRCTTAQNTSVP